MTDSSIYKTHSPGGTDGLYLKLKDGDRIKLRIVSAPAVCTFDGEKLRYNWVVWNRKLDKPQVYQAGPMIFGQIADIYEDWGEPSGYDVSIKRTGSGQFDTEYTVTPVKQSDDLTEAQLKECQLIDLPQACKGKWLSEYESDHTLPPTIQASPENKPKAKKEIEIEDLDGEPIDTDDIPFN